MRNSVVSALVLSFALAATSVLGFVFPGANLSPEANTLLASWRSVSLPSDYSSSKDRFAFELGRMELFGKPSVPTSQVPAALPAAGEIPLSLVAIANLDNKLVALITEDKPFPVRLSIGQQTVSGWAIDEIDLDASTVILTRQDQTQILRLYPDTENEDPS